ncbi:MAG: glycosyltransferase family 4 protein [Patescibacteria group bacterium]|nr:glycosyltransferase family 4 protein [Patescibacteria group bacterium]
MNVLVIGSDRNLFVKGSDAQKRIMEYGKLFDQLHVIVFADKKLGLTELKLDENVWVYPTGHSYRFLYLGSVFRIARSAASRCRLSVITTQDPFEAGFAGWLLKLRLRIPLQIQVHTDFLSPYFAKESLLNRLRVMLAKFLLRRADGIRVVSERIRKSILTLDLRPSAKISVLPIFVDVKKIQSAKIKTDLHQKYPGHDFIILMASRLTREKNIGMAIEAFARVRSEVSDRNPLLLIVGDGPELGKLKAESKRLNVDAGVSFEPWTNDMISYYKTADLFLLTSNYEGYGRTVVEAMAAGLPVAMTDVGLAGELLIDDLDGVVVPVGKGVILAESIVPLLHQPERTEAFKTEALRALKDYGNKAEYLASYKNILEQCVSSS